MLRCLTLLTGEYMKIAVTSGKGGAGKTCVSASLLRVWSDTNSAFSKEIKKNESKVCAVDTDVEAPNLHLFLRPSNLKESPSYLTVPRLNKEACQICGKCRNICQFKAIAKFGQNIQIFQEMCHACGACFYVCEHNALEKDVRELGVICSTVSVGDETCKEQTFLEGSNTSNQNELSKQIPFIMGRSRIGEAMTPPLLKNMFRFVESFLQKEKNENGSETASEYDLIIDSPPGVSCPAMTVVGYADLVIIVAEPTPFGLHDFKLAHTAFRQMDKALVVLMNKSGMQGNEAGDADLENYCKENNLPIVGRIPFSTEIVEKYAVGTVLADISKEYYQLFQDITVNIKIALQNLNKGCE